MEPCTYTSVLPQNLQKASLTENRGNIEDLADFHDFWMGLDFVVIGSRWGEHTGTADERIHDGNIV